jgi:hypothetical protein
MGIWNSHIRELSQALDTSTTGVPEPASMKKSHVWSRVSK